MRTGAIKKRVKRARLRKLRKLRKKRASANAMWEKDNEKYLNQDPKKLREAWEKLGGEGPSLG